MAENTEMPDLGTDKPPKTQRTRGRGRPAKADLGSKIIEGWTGIYALLGAGVVIFNQYDGSVIVHKSHDMAVTLEQVARRNKEVYAWLARFAEANDFTAVFRSYGAVGAAISANHGLLPTKVVDAFDLPRPPEREEQRVPSGEGPVTSPFRDDTGADYYENVYAMPAPPEQAVPFPPNGEVPQGLHVSEDIVAKLRAESLRHAMEQAGLAAQQGGEGLPNPNTNPRGAVNG